MRRLVRVGGALALAVALAMPALAGRVQVFASVSQRVVGVGEPFRLEVEAVVVGEADAAVLERALAAAPLALGADFEVVRAEAVAVTEGAGGLALRRELVVRALREGALDLPGLAVELAGEAVTTRPHRLYAYRASPRLYAAARSVLPVVAEGPRARFIGSGFLVAQDALVTSYHVVVGADRVRIELPDGTRLVTRKAWAVDPLRDVVVLHVDPAAVRRAGLTPLPLAPDHEAGGAGVATFTAGWPGGTQRTGAGVRYADLRPAPDQPIRVSSNRVGPGDSGGPLLDAQGRVLGVVTSGRAVPVGSDVLAEDVCLATDPRPALARRTGLRRPYRLRDALAVSTRADAHAQVLETVAALTHPGRWRAGERERHLRVLRDLAAEAPRNPDLQFLIGSALEEGGDEAHAAEAYRAALDGFRDYFPAAYALGHHHLRAGRYDEAAAVFEAVHRHEPYARLAALELARVAAARLDYAEAEGYLREVLHREPRFTPALYLLGYARLAQGDAEAARGLLLLLRPLSPAWAERLALHLREPVLHPVALAALPPAPPR